jgi:pyruvate kinase
MRRTKIVCTIGPATCTAEAIHALVEAGMDMARVNFSHGSRDRHAEVIASIHTLSEELGRPIAILADLQGPKLRVGDLPEEGFPLVAGEEAVLTTHPAPGKVPIQYADLPRHLSPGQRILLDDGLLELRVLATTEEDVRCEVVAGGLLYANKGINLPHAPLGIPAITDKDRGDLTFALAQGVDWVALSFVRTAAEVKELKRLIAGQCASEHPPLVMAKIEKAEALAHIDAILAETDGVMVARGDLGVETSPEQVPMVQKQLIRAANAVGKPVITATEMLVSMEHHPRPSRAEASDVANAILDGSDALMLSGETAVGDYPVETVQTMARIIGEVERALLGQPWQVPSHIIYPRQTVTDAVSHAVCETAHDLNLPAIISATASGQTARMVSKYRPHAPIIAVTPSEVVQRQLVLSWGVYPLLAERANDIDQIMAAAIGKAREAGLVASGDRVAITAGVTAMMPGTTNLMTIEVVG